MGIPNHKFDYNKKMNGSILCLFAGLLVGVSVAAVVSDDLTGQWEAFKLKHGKNEVAG